nr:S41 family peptidase [Vibrio sonorensis]
MEKRIQFFVVMLLALFLIGCGSGDSDPQLAEAGLSNENEAQSDDTDAAALSWQLGDYSLSSDDFSNLCEEPRLGLDPYNSYRSYPDKSGSALHEKMYLRAFSNENYLWYDEIPDEDPNLFSSVISYFNNLKSFEKTDGGRYKDRFHFSVSYDDYMKAVQSGMEPGFGIHWMFYNNYVPRDLRVVYTDSGSQAEVHGVARGDRVIEIDGIDLVNTNSSQEIAYLNQALTSPTNGKTYYLTLQTNNGAERVVALTAGDVPRSYIKTAKVIRHNGKGVGYLQLNAFSALAQESLIDAFNYFRNQNIEEIVLDLRYNSGGLILQAAQLGHMLTGAGENRVFSRLVYNDKRMREEGGTIYPFLSYSYNWQTNQFQNEMLPSINVSRVYVLSTHNTASASEELINALRGIDVEVVLIGAETTGKPYGFTPVHNCGTFYYTIEFQAENEKGFGDYADGLIPTDRSLVSSTLGVDNKVEGCRVNDDLSHPLGDESEGMLAAALEYMVSSTCPSYTASTAAQSQPAKEGIPMHNWSPPLTGEAIHVHFE